MIVSGRRIECLDPDGVIADAIELARLTQTPAPACEAVHALLALLGNTLKEEQAAVRLARPAP